MNLKIIAISMTVILALLFLLTPLFRKREKKIARLEIQYAETLKALRENPTDEELRSKLKALANQYIDKLGLKQSAEEMLAKDLA